MQQTELVNKSNREVQKLPKMSLKEIDLPLQTDQQLCYQNQQHRQQQQQQQQHHQ